MEAPPAARVEGPTAPLRRGPDCTCNAWAMRGLFRNVLVRLVAARGALGAGWVAHTCLPTRPPPAPRWARPPTTSDAGSSAVQLPCRLLGSAFASNCRQVSAAERTRLAWCRPPSPPATDSASLLSLSEDSRGPWPAWLAVLRREAAPLAAACNSLAPLERAWGGRYLPGDGCGAPLGGSATVGAVLSGEAGATGAGGGRLAALPTGAAAARLPPAWGEGPLPLPPRCCQP